MIRDMMLFFRVIITVIFVFVCVPRVDASTYVDLGDEVYQILSRLEAEGVIQSGLLSIKPISRKETIRLLHEAESRAEGRSIFVQQLIQSLKETLKPEEPGETVIKPVDTIYAKYISTNADVHTLSYGSALEKEQAFNDNNDGDLYAKGSNYRFGITSRAEDIGPFSFYLNPEFKNSDSNENLIIKKIYGVLGISLIDVVVGRDSQWWGPGFNGALLLTNNAEPFTMVKLTNPDPIVLPWFFKYLGPFQFSFFVTQLEEERTVPEPSMWGLRLDFKPHPNLEIGFERTALLGGEGRPRDLGIWAQSIYGFNNADNCWNNCYREPGDQRAGGDVKLTLPFQVQPVQIYVEADGEDQRHELPDMWAFVGGVYLPRIFSVERLDFRAEYATTRGGGQHPYVWYTHHLFDSYTYQGMIIGHHIGTDSDDLFTELSYLVPEKNGRLFLSFDREGHNITRSTPSAEIKEEISVGANMAMTKNTRCIASYGYGWIKNVDNFPAATIQVQSFIGQIAFEF